MCKNILLLFQFGGHWVNFPPALPQDSHSVPWDSFPVMMDYDCYFLDIWISHLPATATCKFYLYIIFLLPLGQFVFPHVAHLTCKRKAWKDNQDVNLQMEKGIKLCDTADSDCCRSEWLCFPTYFSLGTFIHNKFKQRTEPDLGFFFVLSAFYLLQNLSVMDSSGCKAASLRI